VLLAAAVLANAAGWSRAWFSTTAGEWVHMSAGSAAVVKQAAHEAAASDEVVASQGFLGVFAGRQQVYSFSGPIVVPIRSHTVWFVVSPTQGLQVATQAETFEALDTIARLPGVQALEVDDNDVWVYRWHPPAGTRSVALGEPGSPYPIWMVPGPDGVALTAGPASSWGVSSTTDIPSPEGGYLFTADFYQLLPGRYEAEVRYQSDGPVTPEVYDDNTSTIIAGPPSGVTQRRPRVFRLYFDVPAPAGPIPESITGSGLYRDEPIPTIKRATVSVQIWMPPGAIVRAWWSAIRPAPAHS
jgi:hypothetical protein